MLNNSGLFGKLVINFTINNSESFTAVSKKSLDILKTSLRNNSDDLNYKIIPMGVDEVFLNKTYELKKEEGVLTNFLYFGRMIDTKGLT